MHQYLRQRVDWDGPSEPLFAYDELIQRLDSGRIARDLVELAARAAQDYVERQTRRVMTVRGFTAYDDDWDPLGPAGFRTDADDRWWRRVPVADQDRARVHVVDIAPCIEVTEVAYRAADRTWTVFDAAKWSADLGDEETRVYAHDGETLPAPGVVEPARVRVIGTAGYGVSTDPTDDVPAALVQAVVSTAKAHLLAHTKGDRPVERTMRDLGVVDLIRPYIRLPKSDFSARMVP
ncbi:MAG: hypothetical protein RID91_16060 [Azospirillaceae bacterium]